MEKEKLITYLEEKINYAESMSKEHERRRDIKL